MNVAICFIPFSQCCRSTSVDWTYSVSLLLPQLSCCVDSPRLSLSCLVSIVTPSNLCHGRLPLYVSHFSLISVFPPEFSSPLTLVLYKLQQTFLFPSHIISSSLFSSLQCDISLLCFHHFCVIPPIFTYIISWTFRSRNVVTPICFLLYISLLPPYSSFFISLVLVFTIYSYFIYCYLSPTLYKPLELFSFHLLDFHVFSSLYSV